MAVVLVAGTFAELDLPRSVRYAYASGDTIVFGAAGEDATSAWQLAVDERDQFTPEDQRLYAFSAEDGSPLWDHAHEGFSAQVVGTGSDTVAVRASPVRRAGEQVRQPAGRT